MQEVWLPCKRSLMEKKGSCNSQKMKRKRYVVPVTQSNPTFQPSPPTFQPCHTFEWSLVMHWHCILVKCRKTTFPSYVMQEEVNKQSLISPQNYKSCYWFTPLGFDVVCYTTIDNHNRNAFCENKTNTKIYLNSKQNKKKTQNDP